MGIDGEEEFGSARGKGSRATQPPKPEKVLNFIAHPVLPPLMSEKAYTEFSRLHSTLCVSFPTFTFMYALRIYDGLVKLVSETLF